MLQSSWKASICERESFGECDWNNSSNHSFHLDFVCVCSAQDCSLQAQSNLTFLSILKEPCEELEQLKPSQIASKLKHIVSLIRIIWINSPHYNTSERIVNFFRQVPEMLNSR